MMDGILVLDWIKPMWCWQLGALLRLPSMLGVDSDLAPELIHILGSIASQSQQFKDRIMCCYIE